jgi:hypothetical protein
MKSYLLSIPERLIRAVLGLGAGAAREAGEAALPAGVRNSQLYKNLVDTTLRFLIENVGGAEGVYKSSGQLPDDFVVRRAAGNAVEVLGIVAFRASPVWVLAALADLAGVGRQLIPEIAGALKAQGLLEPDARFQSVDELLDGLQRTSARVAATINTPPMDVAGLRAEWDAIRHEARALQPAGFPTGEAVAGMWSALKAESAHQQKSIFETSSMMAMSAVRATGAGTMHAGQLAATALLDHYRQTLAEMRQLGYAAYASRQLRPYLNAAASQFSPERRTVTERVIEKLR